MIGSTRRASIGMVRSVPGPQVRVARMEPSPFELVSLALALLLSRAGGRATTHPASLPSLLGGEGR